MLVGQMRYLQKTEIFVHGKENNMKLKITLVCLMIVALVFSVSCKRIEKTGMEFKIDFGSPGEPVDISKIKISYDLRELENKISGKTAYIYGSSKIEKYDDIAEQFGFTALQILPAVDDVVEYQEISDDHVRRLLIWPTGTIRYDTGVEETSFETKVNQNDCVELSKQVLDQYGLTNHRFDSEWNYSERRLTDPQNNKTTVIGYTVILYFLLNGTRLYGEPRVTIQFNGNGEVVSIMYNMPDYYEAGECELTGIGQLLKSIKKGTIPMMYGFDEEPESITIEDIDLCYYSQTSGDNIAVAQPIYVLSAIGHYEDKDLKFNMLVQANPNDA